MKKKATFSTKGKTAKKFGSASSAAGSVTSQKSTGVKFSTAGKTVTGASSVKNGTNSSPERQWSDEQKAIFKEAAEGVGHLVVKAYAGTGKTTTIIEATKYLSGDVLLCAFNKRIADELQHRLDSQPGPAVKAKTLHALGFSYLQRSLGRLVVDPDRSITIINRVYSQNQKGCGRDALWAMKRLVSLIKETIGKEWKPEHVQLVDMAFGCSDLLLDRERELLYELCPEVLIESARIDGTCDYSDMLWLPLIHDCVRAEYDVVIVDEAQDMNQCQLLLAQAACRKGGRIIVVGDEKQAIYGFRGASSDSLAKLGAELKAKTLKLSTTYRCGQQIVKMANQFVPDFRAHEKNPSGTVSNASTDKMLLDAAPGDFILSRANAPLVKTCIALVRQGKRAKVEGKEIGKGLIGILRKTRATHITEVATLVDEWAHKLTERLDPDRDKQRIEQVFDQADVLTALSEEVADIRALESRIEQVFADTGGSKDTIVCSTVHKAKGLEAERVFMLIDTFKGRKGEAAIPTGEEANIRYVAITRAIKELVLVSDKGVKNEKEELKRLSETQDYRGEASRDAGIDGLDEYGSLS